MTQPPKFVCLRGKSLVVSGGSTSSTLTILGPISPRLEGQMPANDVERA